MYVRPEFDTQFDRRGRDRRFARTGNRIVKKYRPAFDELGVLRLVDNGTHDLYAEIQSYADSTDIATIIARYFNGDPLALSRVQGVYADVTGMPDSIHGVYNMMAKASDDFKTLPAEVQAKFGNDVFRFLSTLGTPEWMAAMQVEAPKQDVPKDVVADAAVRAEAARESEVL